MTTITQEQIDARVAEAKALQTANKGGNSSNAQGMAVYEILKKEQRILSTDARLAKLNPKYPTDAVWTNLAVRMREQLAIDGYAVIATGRKPTVYRLVALPSAQPAAKAPAVTPAVTGTVVAAGK
jgi:hypothetical protein